jgi:hypothetical protein
LFFDTQNNPFEQNNLFAGVSGSFENLYELREYYDKSLALLKEGLKQNCAKHIFYAK